MVGKIIDPDSGEVIDYEECAACGGMGGWDVSNDPEVYDEWEQCEECGGSGKVELGHFEKEAFDPKRDAFTPND